MQTVQLTESQPSKPASATGFSFTILEKSILLVLILGLLYLRLVLRRRKRDIICSHCGTRNLHHMTHCRQCSAPLFRPRS